MTKVAQKVTALCFGVFGVAFVVSLLALAIYFPSPTAFQYVVFRTVLALAAAGVALMVPGFLQVTVANWLRAGGALAVFVVVYFYNPAELLVKPQQLQVLKTQIVTPIPKLDSRLELVDFGVEYPEGKNSDLTLPVVDLKMRNTGDQVAFVKQVAVEILDSAEFEDCGHPQYELIQASATYDLDLAGSPVKAISHSIKHADVDRIKLRIGRSVGGPILTVYKVLLRITYDEDDKKVESKVWVRGMAQDCHLHS